VYDNGNILGRRVEMLEKLRIEVEIPMIQTIYDLLPDDVRKYFHVHDIARTRIRQTCHFNDQFVIVAMIVWEIAFPKNGSIRSFIPIRIVQTMGGVEMLLAADGDWMDHGMTIDPQGEQLHSTSPRDHVCINITAGKWFNFQSIYSP
jgi:hypothetical protein